MKMLKTSVSLNLENVLTYNEFSDINDGLEMFSELESVGEKFWKTKSSSPIDKCALLIKILLTNSSDCCSAERSFWKFDQDIFIWDQLCHKNS